MIANLFNKYFCSLAENLNKASTDDTMCHENPNLTTYLPTSNKKSIFSMTLLVPKLQTLSTTSKPIKQAIFQLWLLNIVEALSPQYSTNA